MENSVPESFEKSEFRNERYRQKARADEFDNERSGNDKAHKSYDPADLRSRERISYRGAFVQSDFMLRPGGNAYRDGYNAKTADLYKQKYDYLTEKRPVRGGIYRDEPRNAGCGNGSENRVAVIRPLARNRRYRKRQQKTSDQYDRHKRKNHTLRDGYFFEKVTHMKTPCKKAYDLSRMPKLYHLL